MSQPDLFSLSTGTDRKESGQAQVAEHNPDFVQEMRQTAVKIARENGTVTSDDLRRYALRHGLKPNSPNCWGAIFLGKEWRVVGHKRSELVSNHARTIKVFALTMS